MDLFILAFQLLLLLIIAACDVTAFFLVIRLVARASSHRLVTAFNNAGRALVDGMLRCFEGRALPEKMRQMPEPARLLVSLSVLWLSRLLLGAFVSALSKGGPDVA